MAVGQFGSVGTESVALVLAADMCMCVACHCYQQAPRGFVLESGCACTGVRMAVKGSVVLVPVLHFVWVTRGIPPAGAIRRIPLPGARGKASPVLYFGID